MISNCLKCIFIDLKDVIDILDENTNTKYVFICGGGRTENKFIFKL